MKRNREDAGGATESVLERNLRSLFQRAYRPIEASSSYREALRARVLEAAEAAFAGARRARLARVRARRIALAASILLVAGAVLAWVLGVGARPDAEPNFAGTPSRLELVAGFEPRVVAVPGGRIELLPNTTGELRGLGASRWSIELDRGEASVHCDDAVKIGVLETETIRLTSLSGRSRYTVRLARTRGDETMKWNRIAIPAGVAAGGLVVYLMVHDGAVEIGNARGKEIALSGESAFAVGDGAPTRAPAPSAAAAAAASQSSAPAGAVLDRASAIAGSVHDAAGRPLASARIEAGRLEKMGRFVPLGASATTGESGRFVLRAEPGTLRLRGSAPGYASQITGEIEVTEGREVEDVLLVLPDGGPATGRVLDDTGRGIEGASVTAMRQETLGGELALGAATDAFGGYRLDGLAENEVYVLTASKADHATAQALNVRAHSQGVDISLARLAGVAGRVVDDRTFSPVTAFRVTVQKDVASYDRPEPVRRDFESADGSFRITGIEPGDYSVFVSAAGFAACTITSIRVDPAHVTDGVLARLQQGGVVRGRVVARSSGEPIAGADVFSMTDAPPRSYEDVALQRHDGPSVYRTITAADGTFELPHLSEGLHTIAAQHADFASERKASVQVSASSPVEGVTLQLSGGGAIAGTVRDPDGKPIRGAGVFALDVGRDVRDSFMSWDETDDEGRYSIPRLTPGHYVVGFETGEEASPYAMNRNVSATVTEGRTTLVDFPATQQGSRLIGLVTDSKGDPLPQIWLTADRVKGGADAVEDLQFKSGMTDADGRYEIRELKAGTYAIYLQKGFAMSFAWAAFVSVGSTPEEIRRDLVYSDATITGRVVDAATGAPISAASAVLNLTTPEMSTPFFAGRTQTDGSGVFSVRGLVPGVYQLVVTATGYGQESIARLELTPDPRVVDLEFRLHKGGSLVVRVADPDGAPVAGAFVIIRTADDIAVSDMSSIPKTNASGEYALPGLKPGRYQVRIVKTGMRPGLHPVDVQAGDPTVVTLTMEPASDPPR